MQPPPFLLTLHPLAKSDAESLLPSRHEAPVAMLNRARSSANHAWPTWRLGGPSSRSADNPRQTFLLGRCTFFLFFHTSPSLALRRAVAQSWAATTAARRTHVTSTDRVPARTPAVE